MNKHSIQPREAVRALRGFTPDLSDRTIPELRRILGREDVIKLSFNESPYGPSPQVITALGEAAAQAHLYHDPEGKELREALAQHFAITADSVFLANGADEIITLIAQAFLSPGDEVIVTDPTFGQYAFAAKLMGAQPVVVPVRANLSTDLAAMAGAITGLTKLIVLCNPNNPTGLIIGSDELAGFLEQIPGHVLVVLDEAYAEYVDDSQFLSGIGLVDKYPNIIAVRTFSKIHGLAGLRLGYGIAHPQVAALIDRVRSPFNVNALAQVAALAALADTSYSARVATLNAAERRRLTAALTALGYKVYSSQANFVFADTGQDSEQLCQALAKEGIIIRNGANWAMPAFVRITLGNSLQNDRLIESVKNFNSDKHKNLF